MVKQNRFVMVCQHLGNSWGLIEETINSFEEYICHLYRKKSTSVSKVRFEKFQATYKVQNKIPDLLILPPCKQLLVLHLKRANYIAKLWKSLLIPRIESPDITGHGWKSNGDVL